MLVGDDENLVTFPWIFSKTCSFGVDEKWMADKEAHKVECLFHFHTVDGWNPKQPRGEVWNPINNGITRKLTGFQPSTVVVSTPLLLPVSSQAAGIRCRHLSQGCWHLSAACLKSGWRIKKLYMFNVTTRSLVYSNMNVSNFKTRNEYSMFAVNCCFCLWFYLRLGVSGILKLVVASSWQRCVVPWSEAWKTTANDAGRVNPMDRIEPLQDDRNLWRRKSWLQYKIYKMIFGKA